MFKRHGQAREGVNQIKKLSDLCSAGGPLQNLKGPLTSPGPDIGSQRSSSPLDQSSWRYTKWFTLHADLQFTVVEEVLILYQSEVAIPRCNK